MTREQTTPTSLQGRGAVLLAASVLTIMAAAVVSPSLPALQTAFPDTSPILVRQAVTLTSAAIAVTAPFAGMLIRRAGARPVLASGLGIYAFAGTAGLWLSSLPLLLASRAVLGVGVAMIMTAVSTSIAGLWSGAGRARMLAGQQAFASLGGVAFLPLAGILATAGWRAPFLLYAAALLILPFALVVPLLPASRHGGLPTSPASPHVSLPRVVFVLGVATIGTAVFFMVPTQLPFMLADAGVSPAFSGIAVAASTATGVIGALLFPRAHRFADVNVIAAASLLTLGAGWALIGVSGAMNPAGVIVGALVGGVGVGAIVPDFNTWLSDLVHGPGRSIALGGLVAAIFGGQFLSPLILAPLIDALGLRSAFIVAAIVLGLLAVPVIASRPSSQKKEERTE